jgi:hypothetical protein
MPVFARFFFLLAALLPATAHALDFGIYIMLQDGMTEAELIARAGPPDYSYPEGVASTGLAWQGGWHGNVTVGSSLQQEARADVYNATSDTPYLTVVHILGGRIASIERIPRF